MSDKYILEGKTPVPADLTTWATFFDDVSKRVVAKDDVGDVRVSTVFLGIDHAFGDEGGPVLFETMIFGGPNDGYQTRYQTWEEAEAGHAVALGLARSASRLES